MRLEILLEVWGMLGGSAVVMWLFVVRDAVKNGVVPRNAAIGFMVLFVSIGLLVSGIFGFAAMLALAFSNRILSNDKTKQVHPAPEPTCPGSVEVKTEAHDFDPVGQTLH